MCVCVCVLTSLLTATFHLLAGKSTNTNTRAPCLLYVPPTLLFFFFSFPFFLPGGHYTSFVRNQSLNRWLLCDDARVYAATVDDVLKSQVLSCHSSSSFSRLCFYVAGSCFTFLFLGGWGARTGVRVVLSAGGLRSSAYAPELAAGVEGKGLSSCCSCCCCFLPRSLSRP